MTAKLRPERSIGLVRPRPRDKNVPASATARGSLGIILLGMQVQHVDLAAQTWYLTWLELMRTVRTQREEMAQQGLRLSRLELRSLGREEGENPGES